MNERTPVFLRANFPQYDGGEGQRRIPKRRSLFLPGGIDLESLIWGIRLRMVALPYGWWFVPVDFFFFSVVGDPALVSSKYVVLL